MKTIQRNSKGPAVEDVQKRLRVLGYSLNVDGVYLDRTQIAVSEFRRREGLPAGDFVDEAAWAALVDATFTLGDRMLYLRMPYFHGRDVKCLQDILNALGFIVGKADGIFGAHTEHALRDFQASVGLVDDGVAGATTYDAIQRLRHAWEGKGAVAAAEAETHMGFARAASVLENAEIVFFGMDGLGREVAQRAANLAQASAPFSGVASADRLSVTPSASALMVGLGARESLPTKDSHVVAFGEDYSFATRVETAIEMADDEPRRIFIEFDGELPEAYLDADPARWAQHLAIAILDALCSALG
ncbi:MAG: peptidoglycan-binding protein [Coriobacteriales bacterium]